VALDREVVDAVVAPEHVGPSPSLQTALDEWPGTYYWSDREGPNRLVLVRALGAAPRERWWLHALLFVLTFVTVWMAGAALFGLRLHLPDLRDLVRADTWLAASNWIAGSGPAMGFAAALMAILLVHELGHFTVAKRYRINASPPYFLPAPYQINFIGTFGAFIRLRSPVVDRRQLIDVGAAGPWAGFAASVLVLLLGLTQSTPLPGVIGESHLVIYIGNNPFFLGDSLLLDWARVLVAGPGTIQLHPLALAGWFGVFVTMLNLLPLGQLDGGHIVYALIGRHQTKVGYLMWYVLVVLGFSFWPWWVWAALILILGRGRLAHPSVLDAHRPIPRSRLLVGLATAVLFVICFTRVPLPSLV
jgi:Peptidase family M50